MIGFVITNRIRIIGFSGGHPNSQGKGITMKSQGEMKHPAQSKQVILYADHIMEDDIHIARCAALGISDHGSTWEEATDNLGKTLGLFFASCIRRRTIDEILTSKGIEIHRIEGGPDDSGQIYVPVVLLSNQHASTRGN